MASFDGTWRELFPAEQIRIIRLLIEPVTYDAQGGTVEITFRPGDVKPLAEDSAREPA